MTSCVVCAKDIPGKRKGKDTCSTDCGFKKSRIWSMYLMKHSKKIMRDAIEDYKKVEGLR